MDLERLRDGNRGSVARAISMVENGTDGAREMMQAIFPHMGNSSIIGVTGPAGAGKSSLINRLAVGMSGSGDKRPAVLAVDPTSHITGGAILGDRVRMAESTDSGIYIRSIASRGATGAIAGSLRDSIRILEYAGFDPIIVESVGAGQTEVAIAAMADVTIVVFNPHTGDSIQTIKAGITEIGDICVVNKADLPGSSALFDAVRDFIGESDRNPTVLKTSVKDDTGVKELAEVIGQMLERRRGSRADRRAESLRTELRDIVLTNLQEKLDAMIQSEDLLEPHVSAMSEGRYDPYEAADRIVRSILR